MNPATMQLIGAAVGALVIALLGYLTAMVQAHTRAIAANQAALAARPAQAPPRSPRASDTAGGGAAVRPAPAWNQLADPLSQGGLPAQRYQECGEECCAEVIYQQHGVEVSADALRARIHGAAGTGLTAGPDLVKLLGLNNVAAELHTWPVGEAPAHIQASAAAARAVIVLGTWISPTVLHWILVTAADSAGIHYNDPWGGLKLSIPWATFAERYGGQLVTVTRAPDAA
jgi:hypothetical protein